jgi:hypothetical protein
LRLRILAWWTRLGIAKQLRGYAVAMRICALSGASLSANEADMCSRTCSATAYCLARHYLFILLSKNDKIARMTLKEDTIKILEMICAEIIPYEICSEEFQEVTLTENDFKEEGFSFNSAISLIKDIFIAGYIRNFDFTSKDNVNAMLMTVSSNIEYHTKRLKYPEIESEEFLDPNTTTSAKICIKINSSRGIFREDNQELCYPLKTSTNRMKIILCLLHKDRVSISELGKTTGQTYTLIWKEIREINSNFRKKVIDDDFIVRLPTNVYSLNRDKFDVKT